MAVELPLVGSEEAPLVPARMLNEFTYCPRLMYLEWVQGDFEDNADTIDGRYRHRRVDQPGGALALDDEQRVHARSVELAAPQLGLIAKIDLVEADGMRATPVDYKRGAPPDIPEQAWEPERDLDPVFLDTELEEVRCPRRTV